MYNYGNTSKKKSFNFFYPISFILAIIPLIVRMTVVTPEQNTIDMFGSVAKTELFSQKKAFFLMIFCIALIIISIAFFKKIFEKKDKVVTLILISSAVFLLFTFLSAIFSKYRAVSFNGIFDRAEGFITIACYMIIFVYSIYTFKNTNDYKCVIIPILILVVINSFLGLFQYMGQDLIKSPLGTSIVLPTEYQKSSGINLLYEKGKLYGTLFHYNYVGSFVAIVLPILFCLTIFEDYDIMYKISLGIGTLLSVWLLFGSTSRAGIIGLSVATLLGIIIFWKLLIPKWKPALIIILTFLCIAVGLNFATKGAIFERIPGLVSDVFSVFKDTSDFDYKDHVPVKDIKHVNKNVEIVLQNETLEVSHEDGNFVFKNSKNQPVNFVKGKDTFTTTDEAFKNLSFIFGKTSASATRADGLILSINNTPTFKFSLKKDNSIHLTNSNAKKDIDIDFPETFGFKGKEKLGSMRGYIWSRSIPMIKDNLILGNGADTFVFEFPQNDLIAKYYAYDSPNTVVDKPHNLYLQIAINNGLIALLAFLSIMIIYIVDSFKLYAFKKEYEKNQVIGAATCLGVVGYLFAGIFNDSVVSVAPIFWIILGVGVSINYMNKKKLNN